MPQKQLPLYYGNLQIPRTKIEDISYLNNGDKFLGIGFDSINLF